MRDEVQHSAKIAFTHVSACLFSYRFILFFCLSLRYSQLKNTYLVASNAANCNLSQYANTVELRPTPFLNRDTGITGSQSFCSKEGKHNNGFVNVRGTVLFRTTTLPNQLCPWTLPPGDMSFQRPHQHKDRWRDKRCAWFKRSGRLWVRHSSPAESASSPSQPTWRSTAPGKLIATTTMRNSWKRWVSYGNLYSIYIYFLCGSWCIGRKITMCLIIISTLCVMRWQLYN